MQPYHACAQMLTVLHIGPGRRRARLSLRSGVNTSGPAFWPDTLNLFSRFSPSNFVDKWSTPQLLIHGSKDYRLPETESIAAFHALQQSVLNFGTTI